MSQDHNYYAARATEERRLASASADPSARRVHLDLAFKYARLAGVSLPPPHHIVP